MRKDWKVSVLVNYEASSCLRRLDVGFPAASMRWCGLSKGQKVLCHREGVVIRLHVEFRNIIGQKASALLQVCICVGLGAKAVRTLLTISLTNPPRALSATSAKTIECASQEASTDHRCSLTLPRLEVSNYTINSRHRFVQKPQRNDGPAGA